MRVQMISQSDASPEPGLSVRLSSFALVNGSGTPIYSLSTAVVTPAMCCWPLILMWHTQVSSGHSNLHAPASPPRSQPYVRASMYASHSSTPSLSSGSTPVRLPNAPSPMILLHHPQALSPYLL